MNVIFKKSAVTLKQKLQLGVLIRVLDHVFFDEGDIFNDKGMK